MKEETRQAMRESANEMKSVYKGGNMKSLIIDIETIPDFTVPEELWPTTKYGNTKDPEKRKVLDEEFAKDGLIKAMSLDPALCAIVSLQMWTEIEGRFIDVKTETEADTLKLFWALAREHNYSLVGFNILNFDLPVIIFRSMIHGLKTPKLDMRRYQTSPVFDVMEVLANWQPDKRKSLNWWANRFNLETKSADGSQVYQMYKDGKIDEIHDYCRDDVRLTKEIYDIVKC